MRDLEQLSQCQFVAGSQGRYASRAWIPTLNPQFKSNQYDLVIVVVPNAGKCCDELKGKAELEYGILTQCIKRVTLERICNLWVIGNSLLNINSKLNGIHINHTLKAAIAFDCAVNIFTVYYSSL